MTEQSYTFHAPLADAGCWVINVSLHIYVQKRPNWFHQKITKLMLGWDWKDGDYEEQLKKASEK